MFPWSVISALYFYYSSKSILLFNITYLNFDSTAYPVYNICYNSIPLFKFEGLYNI